ncbi:MAG: IPTL-CTERM sorting domain-containing protein, partial [candidate division Zixibacteria bacterium]|nr:IPTL-CTERM sorting domain-containing protein [candidate division Zixibacteria bacterium]
SMPARASEMGPTACSEPDTLSPPIPGDTMTAADFAISYMDSEEGYIDISIDSSSFLQVYLGDVEEGDSTEMEWKVDINGEVSRVRLVGYVLPPGADSVAPSVDGLFAGWTYTLTPYPDRVYVLTFGPLHFTAPGTVEDSYLEISSGDEPITENIPTLSEWGMIVFCALLFAWMAWMLARRRKRITAGM